jgi:hypothetical protein
MLALSHNPRIEYSKILFSQNLHAKPTPTPQKPHFHPISALPGGSGKPSWQG